MTFLLLKTAKLVCLFNMISFSSKTNTYLCAVSAIDNENLKKTDKHSCTRTLISGSYKFIRLSFCCLSRTEKRHKRTQKMKLPCRGPKQKRISKRIPGREYRLILIVKLSTKLSRTNFHTSNLRRIIIQLLSSGHFKI